MEMKSVKVAIGSDHAGRELKHDVKEYLLRNSYPFFDFGVSDDVERADYPIYADLVAKAVAGVDYHLGILICGTGIGMAMAANRLRGARAANCNTEFMARMSRSHNNANILTLGQRVLGVGQALSILDAFLNTPFEGGRHQNRLEIFN